jgi:hypothetical protein
MPFDDDTRARFDRFQRMATSLAGHPKLGEALEELSDSDEEFDRAQRDPKGHLRSKGIELPDEAQVTLKRESTVTVTVCVDGFCVSVSVTIPVEIPI